MNKLLIVGTVAFDSIETPDDKVEKILGGAATHIGISASLFNINSAIVSIVGGDFPSEYIEMFRKRGIDVAAKAQIWRLISEFTKEGGSVIVASN